MKPNEAESRLRRSAAPSAAPSAPPVSLELLIISYDKLGRPLSSHVKAARITRAAILQASKRSKKSVEAVISDYIAVAETELSRLRELQREVEQCESAVRTQVAKQLGREPDSLAVSFAGYGARVIKQGDIEERYGIDLAEHLIHAESRLDGIREAQREFIRGSRKHTRSSHQLRRKVIH